MKKLAVMLVLLLAKAALAGTPADAVNQIESEWANIHYGLPKDKQAVAYRPLLAKALALSKQYPNNADALYWEAVIKANYAEYEDGMTALNIIHEVRELLNKAIAINPDTMAGSAYVVLGTLYYMTPVWPIAFGDNDEADELLKKALKINPAGIDSNYFYGDFLLSKNEFKEAEIYFNKAISAPVRPGQAYGDNELKKEAKAALEKAKQHKNNGSKGMFSSLFGL